MEEGVFTGIAVEAFWVVYRLKGYASHLPQTSRDDATNHGILFLNNPCVKSLRFSYTGLYLKTDFGRGAIPRRWENSQSVSTSQVPSKTEVTKQMLSY